MALAVYAAASVLLVAAIGLGTGGCGREGQEAELSAAPPTAATSASAATVAARERRDRGRALYVAECSGCHGERGRGDGPAVSIVDPQPRDFIGDKFKYRSTASGAPPRREDIVATIARGMPGSAMPAFHFLSEDERVLIAEYVLWLMGRDDDPEPEVMAIGKPTSGGADAIERGRAVYAAQQCAKCHGESGRGDGPSASTLVDSKQRPIRVRDLGGALRRGENAAEIARVFLTGIDGTPMPSYAEAMTEAEAWDLAHYVMSMRRPTEAPPQDPLARGRWVVEQKQCYACHVIEARGAVVGPSLDVSAAKLRYNWTKTFLQNPRATGKIYPFMPYRMPDLQLSAEDIDGVLTLMAHVAGRKYPEPEQPPVSVADADADKGLLYYVLRCAECHNLGSVIPTPPAKQQGPDLINVQNRLRFEWIPEWVANPREVYPGTKMVDTNLTDEDIRIVRAFLWRTSGQNASR